jgi:hypothetical protein
MIMTYQEFSTTKYQVKRKQAKYYKPFSIRTATCCFKCNVVLHKLIASLQKHLSAKDSWRYTVTKTRDTKSL